MPRKDAGQSKTARMTRAELRNKKNELIQAKPVIGELKVKDLYDAFGQPTRKQTIGRETNWYWQCKDGQIKMRFADLGNPHLDKSRRAWRRGRRWRRRRLRSRRVGGVVSVGRE